ncbi:aldo/keto reductase [Dactylosporangium sp. NPDC048998]|uniref:aldo/keto reductase n=1 Tax=Dactylosporangium sp. NPDC048998 TaxID=3363976 RepID=UPI00371992B1
MTLSHTPSTRAGGTYAIGGDLPVARLGYGAMRLTGPGIWDLPADPDNAVAVLRRAVELGVTFIDTADCYGPYVSEDLIRRALHPYDGVTIATKGGVVRPGPGLWRPVGRPEYLRQCVEMSLRRLGVCTIDLYQLHAIDPLVPLADQLGVLAELRAEGKIRHIGLSEVTVAEIEASRALTPIASVQNQYNLTERRSEEVLAHCEREGICFIPWFPLAKGVLARPGGGLETVAAALGATPSQVALAWLLRRSPVVVPIPGTTSLSHLAENCAAAALELTDEQAAELDAPAGSAGT